MDQATPTVRRWTDVILLLLSAFVLEQAILVFLTTKGYIGFMDWILPLGKGLPG